MLAGPLLRVELVGIARRRRHFVLRVGYALLLLFVLWATYESTAQYSRAAGQGVSIQQAAQAAQAFFWSYAWLQLAAVLLIVPAQAAGTIAAERERRTIEYLFVTDLGNAEIVLGKVVAKLLQAGKLLLVGVPILMAFRLLGGIPARLLLLSLLSAASTAIVLTSLGVCISVWSPKARDATTRTYLAIIAVGAVPGIVQLLLLFWARNPGAGPPQIAPLHEATQFLIGLNPIIVLGQEMTGRFAGASTAWTDSPLVRMAAWHVAIAAGLVAAAVWGVRRVHLRTAGRGAGKVKTKQTPSLAARRWRWKPQLGDWPMTWKESFAPASKTRLGIVGALATAAIVLATGAAIATAYLQTSRWQDQDEYFEFLIVFSGIVGSAGILMTAARAAGLVTLEKEQDCWITLLSTPLTGRQIVLGKVLGNLYAARWLAILLAAAWGLGITIRLSYLGIALLLLATLTICCWFASALGVWFSLRSSTSLRAQGLTLATLLFVGGGYLMFCCPVVALSSNLNDEAFILGLAPCIPFLMAFPNVAYDEGVLRHGDEGVMFATAYVAGSVLYLVAAAGLTGAAIGRFEELAPRTTGPEGRREA